jgi:hypothetical protein
MGCSLADALHIGGDRELGKIKKYDMVFGADGAFQIRKNATKHV